MDQGLGGADGSKGSRIGIVLQSVAFQLGQPLEEVNARSMCGVWQLLMHERDELSHGRVIDGLGRSLHEALLTATGTKPLAQTEASGGSANSRR